MANAEYAAIIDQGSMARALLSHWRKVARNSEILDVRRGQCRSVALAAGMAAAPATAVESQETTADGGGSEQRAAVRWITLITGDRVAVDGEERPAQFRQSEGRKHIPLKLEQGDGHSYVIPLDAARLIRAEAADKNGGTVTQTIENAYLTK